MAEVTSMLHARHITGINEAATRATGGGSEFFRFCSLTISESACSELRFLRNVLFYYALFCECGAKPVRFCMNQSQFKALIPFDSIETLKIIHALRTQAAHSLEPNPDDDRLLQSARSWFRQHTRHDFPENEDQWRMCSQEIELLGGSVLEGIRRFLEILESDSEMEIMKVELRRAIDGGLRRIEIETILFEVLTEQERHDLSPGAFCDRFLSEWTRSLSAKSSKSDLRREARLLIESTLSKEPAPPPITAQEIMLALKLSKGPIVGLIVRERDRLVRDGIRDRGILLARLSDYLQTLQPQIQGTQPA
jgi:hypothetical protein